MLDKNDKTPKDFTIFNDGIIEKLKIFLRRYLYPTFLIIRKNFIDRKFGYLKKIGITEIFLGYRGTD